MRPILRPEAEFDLVHAYRWYEDQRAGLGAFPTPCISSLEKLRQSRSRRFTWREVLLAFPCGDRHLLHSGIAANAATYRSRYCFNASGTGNPQLKVLHTVIV